MTGRFVSNLTVMLAAGLTLVASLAFRGPVSGWIGFGTGCLVVLTVLGLFPLGGRGIVQRAFDAVMALGGAWLVVASRTFHGAAVKWLMFGSGALLLVLGLLALVLHEAGLLLALRHTRERAESDGRGPAFGHERITVGTR